jgi:hypothetical protein
MVRTLPPPTFLRPVPYDTRRPHSSPLQPTRRTSSLALRYDTRQWSDGEIGKEGGSISRHCQCAISRVVQRRKELRVGGSLYGMRT